MFLKRDFIAVSKCFRVIGEYYQRVEKNVCGEGVDSNITEL